MPSPPPSTFYSSPAIHLPTQPSSPPAGLAGAGRLPAPAGVRRPGRLAPRLLQRPGPAHEGGSGGSMKAYGWWAGHGLRGERWE